MSDEMNAIVLKMIAVVHPLLVVDVVFTDGQQIPTERDFDHEARTRARLQDNRFFNTIHKLDRSGLTIRSSFQKQTVPDTFLEIASHQ